MSQSEIDEYNKKFAEIEYRFTGGLEKQKIYKTGIGILLSIGLIAAINFLYKNDKTQKPEPEEENPDNVVKKDNFYIFRSNIKHPETMNGRKVEYDMKDFESFKKSFMKTNKEIIDRLKRYEEYDKKYIDFIYICNGVDEKMIDEAKKQAEDYMKKNRPDDPENELGRGSFATVYKWKYEGKEYALKVNNSNYNIFTGKEGNSPIKFSEIYINDCLNIRGNNVKIYGGCNLPDVSFILMEKLDIIKWNDYNAFTNQNKLDFFNIKNILQLAKIEVPDLHFNNVLKISDDRMIIADFGAINDVRVRTEEFVYADFYKYAEIVADNSFNLFVKIDWLILKFYLNIDDENERIDILNKIRNLNENLKKDYKEVTKDSEFDFLCDLKVELGFNLFIRELFGQFKKHIANGASEEKKIAMLNKIRTTIKGRGLILNDPSLDIEIVDEKTSNDFIKAHQIAYNVDVGYNRGNIVSPERKREFLKFIDYLDNKKSDPDASLKLMYELIKLNPDYQKQPDKTKSPPMFFGGDYYFIYILIIVIIVLLILLVIYAKSETGFIIKMNLHK